MHAQIIVQKIVETLLARKIGDILEKFRAEIFIESHDLKQMAVAIARQRRNAHARQNFAQPRVDRGAHALRAARLQRFRKLIRQIRHHGAGAGRHQQRHVMRIENLRRLYNQRHVPQSFAHHRLPYRRGRQQRRKRRALAADAAIRKEEEARASAATQRGRQLSNATARARDSHWGRKRKIDAMHGAKRGRKLRQLARGDNRTRQNHAVRQMHRERHHVRFAQRVDRRIRDLRETLLAVIPQVRGSVDRNAGGASSPMLQSASLP